MHIGFPEIIAILLVILLLFGPGRIEKLAGELGKSIRSFQKGVKGDEKNDDLELKKNEEKED